MLNEVALDDLGMSPARTRGRTWPRHGETCPLRTSTCPAQILASVFSRELVPGTCRATDRNSSLFTVHRAIGKKRTMNKQLPWSVARTLLSGLRTTSGQPMHHRSFFITASTLAAPALQPQPWPVLDLAFSSTARWDKNRGCLPSHVASGQTDAGELRV